MSALARRTPDGERSLSFLHLHTWERTRTVFWADGAYVREGLDEINHFLRDFRTGEVHAIDPALLDLLYVVHRRMESVEPFYVVSGYRSPKTNAMLAKTGHGVAKHSLHMAGMAVDVRLPDRGLRALRTTAVKLRSGGVGYYPKSKFVHLDVGRFRTW